ncbi:putative sodium-dependent phosphate transport protein 2B [Apostichopus japonicus]|nr:putative sodium-dependent phosphate transport protein 2B [Apostichopus japonicus]
MRCEDGETGSTCNHIFAYSDLSDAAVGGILLLFSLLILTTCLLLLVRMLQWILQGQRTMKLVRKALNANFPGVFSFLTGYFAILVGAILTFLVQSSSVFTSAITPLVGMGLITIKRMYPLTLGSNIGTTGTSILAALAQPDNFLLAMQVSLCHLFFNILGISIWYPIPFMRNVPINLAKNLGNNTAKYRWFAMVYLITIFFFIPMSVFALSLAGPVVFLSVAVPIGFILIVIIIVNIMQAKAPKCLPKVLRNWKFLPEPLRSLRPYDAPFTKAGLCCKQCCPKRCCGNDSDVKNAELDQELEVTVGDTDEGIHQSQNEMKVVDFAEQIAIEITEDETVIRKNV